MQELLPQIQQYAAEKTAAAAHALNSLNEVARVLSAVREDYSTTFTRVFVAVDSGKYKGERLNVVRLQLDEVGVTIWATKGDPRPFKVTGQLEVQ